MNYLIFVKKYVMDLLVKININTLFTARKARSKKCSQKEYVFLNVFLGGCSKKCSQKEYVFLNVFLGSCSKKCS